jgi:hypothetical protein
MAGPVTRANQTGDELGVGFVQFIPLIAAGISAVGGAYAAKKAASAARKAQQDQLAAEARAQANALQIAQIQAQAPAFSSPIPGLGVDGKTLAMLAAGVGVVLLLANRR